MADFNSPADSLVAANFGNIFGQNPDGGVPDNSRGSADQFFKSQVAESFGGGEAPTQKPVEEQAPDLSWLNGAPQETDQAQAQQSSQQTQAPQGQEGGNAPGSNVTQLPTQSRQTTVNTPALPLELSMNIESIMQGLNTSLDETFNVTELDKQFGEVAKENNLGFAPPTLSDDDITAIGEGDYRPITQMIANAQASTMRQTVVQSINLIKGYLPALFESYTKQYEAARGSNNVLHDVHGNFKDNPAAQQLSVILAQRYLSHKPTAQSAEVIAKVKEAMAAQNPKKVEKADANEPVPTNWAERPASLPV